MHLIADPVLLQPYLQELMPLLQECLLHPTVGVQHEAAKAFGSLAFGLPEICDRDILPFLLTTLKSQEQNQDVSEVERRGAARGLAEVLLARRDLLPGASHIYKVYYELFGAFCHARRCRQVVCTTSCCRGSAQVSRPSARQGVCSWCRRSRGWERRPLRHGQSQD